MNMTFKKIVLILHTKHAFDRKVLDGIASYVRENGGWEVEIEEDFLRRISSAGKDAIQADGIIAHLSDPALAEKVASLEVPTVAFGGGVGLWGDQYGIPHVASDVSAISRVVLEHFTRMRLNNLAFCGSTKSAENAWSKEQEQVFTAMAAEMGLWVPVFHGRDAGYWNSRDIRDELGEWLKELPKPVGILAANDKLGRKVIESCHRSGIRVPEEVAVVGVDNDEAICNLCNPRLSSVEQDGWKIGRECSELLCRMLRGERLNRWNRSVGSSNLIVRGSCDALAGLTPDVRRAQKFIRIHCREGINAIEVARKTGVSRSTLERRFKEQLEKTISDQIRSERLRQAEHYLCNTNMPIKEVAFRCGFSSVPHMTTLFKKYLGKTPGCFQQQHKHRPSTRQEPLLSVA